MSYDRISGMMWGTILDASLFGGITLHPIIFVFAPMAIGASLCFGIDHAQPRP